MWHVRHTCTTYHVVFPVCGQKLLFGSIMLGKNLRIPWQRASAKSQTLWIRIQSCFGQCLGVSSFRWLVIFRRPGPYGITSLFSCHHLQVPLALTMLPVEASQGLVHRGRWQPSTSEVVGSSHSLSSNISVCGCVALCVGFQYLLPPGRLAWWKNSAIPWKLAKIESKES